MLELSYSCIACLAIVPKSRAKDWSLSASPLQRTGPLSRFSEQGAGSGVSSKAFARFEAEGIVLVYKAAKVFDYEYRFDLACNKFARREISSCVLYSLTAETANVQEWARHSSQQRYQCSSNGA